MYDDIVIYKQINHVYCHKYTFPKFIIIILGKG